MLTTFVIACFLQGGLISFAQTQKGADIDGEAANNSSGWSVDMPNTNTIAIGAPSNDEVASGAGHVRVFSWNGSAWTQKGSDIDGRAAFDKSGTVVSMPNENTVATGVPGGAQSPNPFGRLEVYTWNGTDWEQKGNDITGLSAGERFGYSASMPDENTIAIGSIGASTWNNNPSGKVFVYTWNGTDWEQKGTEITGENSGDQFGYVVSMPDANTVGITSLFNDEAFNDAGHVRIYEWNGNAWVQKGTDIDGLSANENFGWSISMPDANTVAAGAPKSNGGGFYSGQVRIFSWNGSSWVQKGNNINGNNIGDLAGYSLSMPNANTLALGATGSDSGHVQIYTWNGSSWEQSGNNIEGEMQGDESGWAVSMGDANTVAIGSHKNKGNGNDAGHVRVYEVSGTSGVKKEAFSAEIRMYPNPTSGNITIQFGELQQNITASLLSAEGKCIKNYTLTNKNTLDINIEDQAAGLYFIKLNNEKGQQQTLSILKK